MSGSTVICGGHVVTMDGKQGEVTYGDVFVKDGVIQGIARHDESHDGEWSVIDASGSVVLPGFVDTHRHTYQSLVRGLLPKATLEEFMSLIFAKVAPAFTPELMYVGNRLGALDAIDAGITTLLDWSPSEGPNHADGAIEGLKDSGIRAIYAHGMPAGPEWWYQSELRHPDDARRIREQHFPEDGSRMSMALALRQPGNIKDEVAVDDWGLAEELAVRVSVHTGMRGSPMPAPIERLGRLDLLGDDTTFIHCTASSRHELEMVRDSGGSISLAPYIEALMGHGAPQVKTLREIGLEPSLSIDTVTTSPGDMFTQMRALFALGRLEALPETDEGDFLPDLDHREILRYATTVGAKACGLDEVVGTLEPGKAADIITLSTDHVSTFPHPTDPVAVAVTSADRAAVDLVMVDGVILKRNGELVIDRISGFMTEASQARERLMATIGS